MKESLKRAIEILNEKRHEDRHDWQPDVMSTFAEGFKLFARSYEPGHRMLTEFEAVAVAKAYQANQPMTLERAVEILNANYHGVPNNEKPKAYWYISGTGDHLVVYGQDQYDFFDPFEAIAIAEKYEREAT